MATYLERVRSLSETLRRFHFQQNELQHPYFRIVNLVRMSEQDKEEFRREIQRNNCRVEVLIHPYYDQDNPEATFPASEQYKQERDMFIQSCLQNKTPLIIFEEANRCKDLELLLFFQKTGTLYTVPTHDKEPAPNIGFNLPFTPINYGKSWQPVFNILNSSGVKRVNIGGRYLVLDQDYELATYHRERIKQAQGNREYAKTWLDRNLVPDKCVGAAALNLLSHFDVSLSPISSPDSISRFK